MKQFVTTMIALCFTASAFATDGTRMIGFNAKMTGRGGTAIGVFDSPTLMMTNPAGLSFLDGSALDVNLSLMIPQVKFTNLLNSSVEGKTNIFPLPDVAYAHHAEENPFTWGIGVFTYGGMGADFTLNHDLFRNIDGSFAQQEYHSKLALMQGGVSAAYRLTPDFSIGVTAHMAYSMLEFTMPYSLSPSVMKGVINPATGMTFGDMFSGSPAAGGFGYTEVTAAAAMNNLAALGFNGKIGLAYRVNPSFTIGASYSAPTALTYKNGKATMDMTAQLNNAFGRGVQGYMAQNPSATAQQAQQAVMAQFAGLGIDLSKGAVAQYDLQTKLTFPQSIGAGVAFKPSESVRLSVDVEWVNWSKAFDKMTINLSNGNNSNINRMLGNSGTFSLDFPMQWKDSYAFRVGGEYILTKLLTLSAGYAYGSNPVPESTIFPVFPAIVENHLMVGITYRLFDLFALNASYELALNKKLDAASKSLIAQEYNSSASQLGENIFHFAMSLPF